MINYNRSVFVEPISRPVRTRSEALAAWKLFKTFKVYQGDYSTILPKEVIQSVCDKIYLQYTSGVVEV